MVRFFSLLGLLYFFIQLLNNVVCVVIGPMILEACKRGNKSFLQKILDENKAAGLKPNLNVRDGLGNTPLHYSAQGQHLGNFYFFSNFSNN